MIEVEELIKQTKDLRLLYVEDNKEARDSTLLILDDLFDNIVVGVDGKDGLEKFQSGVFDLVITDISMPIMNGLNMSRNIKKINYNQPIIILTALTDISIVKEALDIGIDAFLNKPLEDLGILFSKLEQVIKKINYEKTQQELEKAKLFLSMIRNISHHWKQPLSVISMISSECSFKIENGIKITNEDFKGAAMITQKAEELSNMLNKLDILDLDTFDINEFKKLIEISNPICP